MFSTIGILFSGFLLCLIGCFFGFSVIAAKNKPSFKAAATIIGLLIFIPLTLFPLLPQQAIDNISNLTPYAIAAPAVIFLCLILLVQFSADLRLLFVLLTLGCFGTIFAFNLCIEFSASLPLVINQLLTGLLWLTICYCPRLLNLNVGLLSVQALGFGLGGLLLFWLNALPLNLGLFSSCICGCFFALIGASRQNRNIQISDYAGSLIGFILGWFIVCSSMEGCGSSFFIFGIYPLMEIIIAMAQKLTFLPQFSIAKNNTLYIRIVDEEMTPDRLNRQLFRITLTAVLFGAFQVFAPNNYSVPIFCALIILWQTYRIYNWRDQTHSLRETNKKFIKDVKDNLQEISANLQDKGDHNS